MVKVKLIKIHERMLPYITEEEKQRIGKIFEAFEIYDDYQQDEFYQHQYAINLGNGVWFVPVECCEVVEEHPQETLTGTTETRTVEKFLLVEDGSVDIDQIKDDFGINCIVYRQGAKKPEWL